MITPESFKKEIGIFGKPTGQLLLIGVLTLLVYSNSLSGEFVFDDNHMIVENIFIKDPAYFPLFFKGFTTSHPIGQGMCRPLLMLTFAFNYALGKLDPYGYHLFNVFLHFSNAALLFTLLRRLKQEISSAAAFLLALLFAVHPINTEAVTYINGRPDLLVGFFALAGFILYLRRNYLLAGLLYVAALSAKETALVMPLVFIGHHFIYTRRFPESRRFFIGLGLITAAYAFWYMRFFYGTAAPDTVYGFFANIIPQSRATFFYLRLFFWPTALSIVHASPAARSCLTPEALLSLAGMAGLFAGVFLLRKKSYAASLGLFWLLIWRVPLFFAKLNFAVCEHHFYLASLGIYLIALDPAARLYAKNKRIFIAAATAMLLVLSALTYFRNQEYKDNFSLWRSAALRNERSGIAHLNLAAQYLRRDDAQKAAVELEKAVILNERAIGVVYARIDLSALYISQGKYPAAAAELEEALKLNIAPPMVLYQNLGAVYIKMGRQEEAARLYEKAVLLDPGNAGAHYLLGAVYARLGNGRALDELKTAVLLDPALGAAHNDLAVVYASLVPPDWDAADEQVMAAQRLGCKVNAGLLRAIKNNIKRSP